MHGETLASSEKGHHSSCFICLHALFMVVFFFFSIGSCRIISFEVHFEPTCWFSFP